MKKSVLSLICILGLGLSCVFGQNMEMGRMDVMNKMRGRSERGSMDNSEKRNFLKDLKGYVDAYQYFKAIASAPKPSSKKAAKAVMMAERIVKRQDRFLNRISMVSQRLRNVDALSELGNKINTALSDNQAQMQEVAQNNIMKANQGDAGPLWKNMRRYGQDMHRARQRVREFVKSLHQIMQVVSQKVSVFMDDDVDGDDEVNIDMGFDDVDEE